MRALPSRVEPRSSSPSLSHSSVTTSSEEEDATAGLTGEEISVFDVLNTLRRRLFLSRAEVVQHATMATKGTADEIEWVEFLPEYHSHLVKRALVVADTGDRASLKQVKSAMFVYILEVLNGTSAETFFELKSGAAKENRANYEKKRLARKRARAAKRERERESKKVEKIPSSQVPDGLTKICRRVQCTVCTKTFASRKRMSRHRKTHCETAGNDASVTQPSGSKTTIPETDDGDDDNEDDVDDDNEDEDAQSTDSDQTQHDGTPVTGESGVEVLQVRTAGRGLSLKVPVGSRTCEDCEDAAVFIRETSGGGTYPKCLDHLPYGPAERQLRNDPRAEDYTFGSSATYTWVSDDVKRQVARFYAADRG